MRLFLALELPPGLRAVVDEVRGGLTSRLSGWRWTRADAVHLTVRFLGETASETIARAVPLWREAAAAVPAFGIRLGGVGVFPGPRRPRVLWVGVVDEPDEGRLAALAEGVETACRAAGFLPDRRPFTPHLTLARAAEGAVAPGPDAVPEHAAARVEDLVLFRSDLLPRGAVHTPVERFPLAGER